MCVLNLLKRLKVSTRAVLLICIFPLNIYNRPYLKDAHYIIYLFQVTENNNSESPY